MMSDYSRLQIFFRSLEETLSVAKDYIPFDEIHRYLPFQTSVKSGSHFRHLVVESIYGVQTEKHDIFEGDTLCRRVGILRSAAGSKLPACPGCTAIARGVAVRELR